MKYDICVGKFERVAKRMLSKAKVAAIGPKDNRATYEFLGMERALQALGVDYDLEYDADHNVCAVNVMGCRAE